MTATAIKLTQPGTAITIFVSSAAMATVGKYPEMIFEGTVEATGQLVALAVPKSSADRQLARCGLKMEGAVGHVLKFSRDHNSSDASKPYWGINPADDPANAPKPAPASPRVEPPKATNGASNRVPQGINLGGPIAGLDDAHPEPEPPEDAAVPETNGRTNPAREKLIASFKLYDACFAHALKAVGRLPDRDGIDIETDRGPVVASIAATLYIQANK